MGAGKRATQPWRIWTSFSLRSVALTFAYWFIDGRLTMELSTLYRCHNLKGFVPPSRVLPGHGVTDRHPQNGLGAFFSLAT